MNKVEMGIGAGLLALSATAGSAATAEAATPDCSTGINVVDSHNSQTREITVRDTHGNILTPPFPVGTHDHDVKRLFADRPSDATRNGQDGIAIVIEQPNQPPVSFVAVCGGLANFEVLADTRTSITSESNPSSATSSTELNQLRSQLNDAQQKIGSLTSERDQAQSNLKTLQQKESDEAKQLADTKSQLSSAQAARTSAESRLADALKSLGAADASWKKFAFGAGGLVLGALIAIGVGRWRRRMTRRVIDPATGAYEVSFATRTTDTVTPCAIPGGSTARRTV